MADETTAPAAEEIEDVTEQLREAVPELFAIEHVQDENARPDRGPEQSLYTRTES